MGLPKVWITNELLTSASLNAQFSYVNDLVPVGAIIPFDDHNGTVTFNTDIYAYCNGQTIDDEDSPIDGKVLTDMSNRYLVGFGTEAGGDIGTAAWSATIVGNASHQVNLQHLHTETSPYHRHTITHTHEVENKAHAIPTTGIVYARMCAAGTGDIAFFENSSGTWTSNYKSGCDVGTAGVSYSNGVVVTGTVPAGSDSTTKSQSSNNSGYNTGITLGNSLSTTQSIQPRSKPVRYITRYK